MGKASGWLIIGGSVVMMLGLCFLPAAFGPHADEGMLAGGVAIFAFGTLTCAGGIYLKARALQSSASSSAPKAQPKRQRGGCDLCGLEMPVIHCRVHQIHICGNCVAGHYDFRSCAYVPSTRRSAPAKLAARAAKA
jgi:hypothetical protein